MNKAKSFFSNNIALVGLLIVLLVGVCVQRTFVSPGKPDKPAPFCQPDGLYRNRNDLCGTLWFHRFECGFGICPLRLSDAESCPSTILFWPSWFRFWQAQW